MNSIEEIQTVIKSLKTVEARNNLNSVGKEARMMKEYLEEKFTEVSNVIKLFDLAAVVEVNE